MKCLLQFFGLIFFTLCLPCEAQEVTTERDVSFGEVDGQKLLLDVFLPMGPAPANASRPAIILVHGGAWSMGGKEDFSGSAMSLARQGYVTFSVNYRLATGTRNFWPAQLDDTQRAVRWVRAHAEKYRVDAQRIGALGHSAGGHLVTCLGTRETRDNSDPSLASYSSRVTCVVDMSGPVDLVGRGSTQGDGIVRTLLGGTPAERPVLARDASPLFSVDARSAPFLIIHGRLDDLVPPGHAERLDAALRRAGVESTLRIVGDEGHAILRKENADRLFEETLQFLKKHLSP